MLRKRADRLTIVLALVALLGFGARAAWFDWHMREHLSYAHYQLIANDKRALARAPVEFLRLQTARSDAIALAITAPLAIVFVAMCARWVARAPGAGHGG